MRRLPLGIRELECSIMKMPKLQSRKAMGFVIRPDSGFFHLSRKIVAADDCETEQGGQLDDIHIMSRNIVAREKYTIPVQYLLRPGEVGAFRQHEPS